MAIWTSSNSKGWDAGFTGDSQLQGQPTSPPSVFRPRSLRAQLQAASWILPPLAYPQPPGITGKAITSGLSCSLILIKDSGHRIFA